MSEEKKQRPNECQINYRETKNMFYRCKKSINIKDIDMVTKVHFKIAIAKTFFISASISSAKDETVALFWPYIRLLLLLFLLKHHLIFHHCQIHYKN